MVSEITAPPSSIDAGGTFQTAFGAQVTIPASVINHFRGLGATSLTVGSQTTAEDGHTSGGAPSGAVSPNTESASATNLPQSDTTLAPNTPYTYKTTYNPVTWQTGPGTGVVDFVPGTIDVAVTFVINGTPTTETITCTPPPGWATLGSTTVNPPPATPTFQVPASTPPLQNQVSAGTDGGWGATIANTSTATVTGLSATVSVTDGGAPLSYDLTGMAASGTNCSSAGSGKVTCSIGNLAAGASDTLDVLVKTTGLATGMAITGSASITSSNAASHATTLGSIGVIVVQSGNSTKAVAAPGIALVSTKKPLSKAKASITLTLPTKKIKKPAADRAEAVALAVSLAGTTSDQPATGGGDPRVAGPVGRAGPLPARPGSSSARATSSRPWATSRPTPTRRPRSSPCSSSSTGCKVPAGTRLHAEAQREDGGQAGRPARRPTTGYNTPCVERPRAGSCGSAAHDSLYAQDTVYFTGADPAMGRR